MVPKFGHGMDVDYLLPVRLLVDRKSRLDIIHLNIGTIRDTLLPTADIYQLN